MTPKYCVCKCGFLKPRLYNYPDEGFVIRCRNCGRRYRYLDGEWRLVRQKKPKSTPESAKPDKKDNSDTPFWS